jgi:hypothetical protein
MDRDSLDGEVVLNRLISNGCMAQR